MDRRGRKTAKARERGRIKAAYPPPDGPGALASSTPAAAHDLSEAPFLTRYDLLVAIVLAVAVFITYQPCWHGGFIWDDEQHLTAAELQSWQGFERIWTDVRATTQYYPLLHSLFWLEHAAWGRAEIGYHLANLALHSCAVVLVLAVLRRLNVPGAWLAAGIFALHPVQVESVAWITEQKNTLSAVFYLSAALCYLRFDRTRRPAWYAAAAVLFVAALLSKTITGTLPGALLVVFWWQRGRQSWKQDVLPLVPFFLVGAGFGMLTAWWELQVNRCTGPDFDFTFVQRLLIAGRTAWFCFWKLVWPTNLTFIYPRWQIDAHALWQYAFPLGAAAILVLAWAVRRRSRAPLAGLLYFGGTLFPVLGFLNLYTFRYSFVADHYQYLASLGLIVLASSAAAVLLRRMAPRLRPAGDVASVILLALLAVLSWRQSRMYADGESLYAATLDRDPDCWMAHNNLGVLLFERNQGDAALECYQKALEIKPDYAWPHVNIGMLLAGRGKIDDAIAEYRRALAIDLDDADAQAEAHRNLGVAFADREHLDDAIVEFRKALVIKPAHANAHYYLGLVYAERGQVDDAIAEYRQALAINPKYLEAHNNLGNVLAARGRSGEALAEYRAALELDPLSVEAHNNSGAVLLNLNRLDEAIVQFQQALTINPNSVDARNNLANAKARLNRPNGPSHIESSRFR